MHASICSYSKTVSLKDVTSPRCFSDTGPTAATDSFSLFGGSKTGKLQDFLLLLHRAKFPDCTDFPAFPAPVMNPMPEAQLSSFLDSYQNKPQNACHFFYNLRRLITAAANYSGTQYSSSKLHIHLYKRNLMIFFFFFFPKQTLVSKIQRHILH